MSSFFIIIYRFLLRAFHPSLIGPRASCYANYAISLGGHPSDSKDIISTSKYNTQGFLISDNVEGNFNILYECDENGNIIRILHKNREEKKLVKYYPNGQLKQYGDLKIPLINK